MLYQESDWRPSNWSILGASSIVQTQPQHRLSLANQLVGESSTAPFTPEGALTPEALAESFEIIPAENLGNSNIPEGFGKYTTEIYQSPSGEFEVHFYKNPITGQVYYGLDYKAIFTGGGL
jgi:hypothetical protein